MIRRPPRSTLFPTRRSSDLDTCFLLPVIFPVKTSNSQILSISSPKNSNLMPVLVDDAGDRKSTRLNSSHANISYAVFCLKKKIYQNLYFVFLRTNAKIHTISLRFLLLISMITTHIDSLFFFNDTATTEIYTLPYTTLFRSRYMFSLTRNLSC